ncbi:MAG: LPS export ABC transporter periplasmic protein LptC [Candidatus Krumholzibacteriota bacterium]|nr:LPS export ABC transporter periplasmic protein LptC [Candidatus Krumholzibacteriota bacterium]
MRHIISLRNSSFSSFFSAVIILLPVLIILSCESSDEEYYINPYGRADQVINNFTTVESDSGVVKWRMKAPVARIYNSRKLLVTENPVIKFYDEKGEVSSVVTADKGEINQKSRDLTAIGSVVVTSNEGYTLETESLAWLHERGEIHTEDFVRFTKGKNVTTGYGFWGYPELKEFDIVRDINGDLIDETSNTDEEMNQEVEQNEAE